MTHNLINTVRTFAAGMAALTVTAVANAQMRQSNFPSSNSAMWQMGGGGFRPSTNALLSNNYWGSHSNLYSNTTPYAYPRYGGSGYSGSGYGGGGYGGGGYGGGGYGGGGYGGGGYGGGGYGGGSYAGSTGGSYPGTSQTATPFDQASYEKMNIPPADAVREELRQQRLNRARSVPPASEIASGESLNELLANIQRIQARQAVVGNSIDVDANTLGHINVTTTGDLRGSNEFFKPGALSKWPILLSGDKFAADRKNVLAAFAEATSARMSGTANGKIAVEARKLVEGMKDKLFRGRFDASFTDYTNAVAFIDKLTNTLNVLAKHDALKFLNGTYVAKGNTVSQLADHMITHGLKFAKATSGDEPHYAKLYQLIVSYEIDLSRKAEQELAKQGRALNRQTP